MENTIDILSQFETVEINRRQLLPWWIKTFCWLFMMFGIVVIVCLAGRIFGYTASLTIYGFETNELLSLTGLLIISVVLFKAVTAFALWFEKDYAITLGQVDAVIGIGLCAISMFVLPFILNTHHMIIRFELVLLIPYLTKLTKIKKEWRQQL